MKLVEEGYEVPFGYEEAIGFMFGDEVRDKDGVAATVRRKNNSNAILNIADGVFLGEPYSDDLCSARSGIERSG